MEDLVELADADSFLSRLVDEVLEVEDRVGRLDEVLEVLGEPVDFLGR